MVTNSLSSLSNIGHNSSLPLSINLARVLNEFRNLPACCMAHKREFGASITSSSQVRFSHEFSAFRARLNPLSVARNPAIIEGMSSAGFTVSP